jgi:branched-chain amino acid transport system permease protein
LSDYRLILYGTLLLVSIYWLPSGVVGAVFRRAADSSPALALSGHGAPSPIPSAATDAPGPLLQVAGVGLAFGGVSALADVDVTIESSRIHAVIGPNGAGKTSLLNVLTGYYTPDRGTITLLGQRLSGLPPYAIARLGVARTFQTAQLFGDLTARENVAVGLAGDRPGSLLAALIGTAAARRREQDLLSEAEALLRNGGLGQVIDKNAGSLPAGLARRVEIARALARRPRLLMLDEPAAGLSAREIDDLDAELGVLRDRGGLGIVLVEHHMDLVMGVSDTISVLDQGRVIATGSPASVRDDPAVIEAYLGATA